MLLRDRFRKCHQHLCRVPPGENQGFMPVVVSARYGGPRAGCRYAASLLRGHAAYLNCLGYVRGQADSHSQWHSVDLVIWVSGLRVDALHRIG
jgi:hypothetical protein